MSFISGLLGGQTNTNNPAVQTLQYSGAGGGQGVLNNAIQGQQALASQLQAQAAGQGPNPAGMQLQQAIQQNTASANAQAASQRGINPGLAQRTAMETAATGNQAMAGQAAVAQQQQAVNAQNQLAGLYGTQVGQTLQASQAPAAIQAQMAQGNANNAQSASGGLLGGLGAAVGLAEGGRIPHFDDGGSVVPTTPSVNLQSLPSSSGSGSKGGPSPLLALLAAKGGMIQNYADGAIPVAPSINLISNGAPNPFAALGQHKNKSPKGTNSKDASPNPGTPAPSPSASPTQPPGPQSFAGKFAAGLSNIGQKIGSGVSSVAQGIYNEPGNIEKDLNMAKGGKVPAYVSPGERYLPPSEVKKVEKGEKSPMKAGEKIPGKPKVGGAKNDYRNDTVYKTLKEGGVVLPRSVTMSKDAEKKAMAFMKALNAKKGK